MIPSMILLAVLACKADDEPALEADTPQTYGQCGEELMDCMPAPDTYGGCREYYTEYDLLEDEPVGPWWTACQPSCASDSECPEVLDGTAEPRCRIDDGAGYCELACTADTVCPEGMECPESVGACMWPAGT